MTKWTRSLRDQDRLISAQIPLPLSWVIICTRNWILIASIRYCKVMWTALNRGDELTGNTRTSLRCVWKGDDNKSSFFWFVRSRSHEELHIIQSTPPGDHCSWCFCLMMIRLMEPLREFRIWITIKQLHSCQRPLILFCPSYLQIAPKFNCITKHVMYSWTSRYSSLGSELLFTWRVLFCFLCIFAPL